ncbi:hypothetical protein L3V79_07240 [Thiotrichales bacterium 19S9-12]|nr:hypothetical protein [Thiotrichales bacterium 19S9-11]MCF6812145.1 hypothetical protein [Thiotrichales bacterium 19S9-12]
MKFTKQLTSLLILVPLTLTPYVGFADMNKPKMMLDTINYQISSETNIESSKALVYVSVNASVSSNNLSSIQGQVKQDLNQLTKNSSWVVNDYNQNKSASGLINVSMTLKDRLSSEQLASLTDKLSSLDGNGKQYKITNIDYQPSLEQVEVAKNNLRLSMISDVTNQLKLLNRQTGQKYRIHQINFIPRDVAPQPRSNMMMYAQESRVAKVSAPLTVSTKVILTAEVELAKTNKQGV